MTSLIDRYVAAAADDFPGSDNSAIAREVRAALEDMVDAHMAAGLTRKEAEYAAVEELGEPRQFADQFRQEPRYLIGPRLFRSWWFALRISLAVVIPLFIALAALDFAANGDGSAAGLIGEVIGGAFEGLLQATFWVTLTFAIIQWTGQSNVIEDVEEKWTPDQLPQVSSGRQITISEVILSLVSLIGALFLAVRLSTDQLGAFGMNTLFDLPADTPIFNPDLSDWWGIGFIGLLVFSLLVSVWSFVKGFWATDILVLNLVENGIWLVYLLLLVATGDVINPVIIEESSRSETWALTGENSNNVIIGIGLIILALDVFDAVRGHLTYRSRLAQGNNI